jgi:hypothetical protein
LKNLHSSTTLTFTSEHHPAPEDAYSKFFEAVPPDDEASLRGKDENPGHYVIETDEEMKKFKQMASGGTFETQRDHPFLRS